MIVFRLFDDGLVAPYRYLFVVDGEAELALLQMPFAVPAHEGQIVGRKVECDGACLLRLKADFVEAAHGRRRR